MDYTQLRLRPYIYRDRESIDDFDIENPTSLDMLMLERIESSPIINFEGAAKYIVDIFNNAYYITTLILMERHPVHYLSKYFIIAEHTSSAYPKDMTHKTTCYHYFESMIMAMVYNYICACRPEQYTPLDEKNRLLKAMWDYHNDNVQLVYGDSPQAKFLFFNNVLPPKELMKWPMNESQFAPLTSPEELAALDTGKGGGFVDVFELQNSWQKVQAENDRLQQEVDELVKEHNKQRDTNESLRKEVAALHRKLSAKTPAPAPAQTADGDGEEVVMLTGLESTPVLQLLWYLMQKDGASVEGRGKKKAAQNILSTLSQIPYDTTKKLWRKEHDAIIRSEQQQLTMQMNQWMKAIGMKYRY